MDPPYKSLCACKHRSIRSHIKLRLIINLELFLSDCSRESFYQLLSIQLLFMKHVIVNTDRFGK